VHGARERRKWKWETKEDKTKKETKEKSEMLNE
jgi:hypothetical protein